MGEDIDVEWFGSARLHLSDHGACIFHAGRIDTNRSEPPRFRDCRRQVGRGHAGHWRLEDWKLDVQEVKQRRCACSRRPNHLPLRQRKIGALPEPRQGPSLWTSPFVGIVVVQSWAVMFERAGGWFCGRPSGKTIWENEFKKVGIIADAVRGAAKIMLRGLGHDTVPRVQNVGFHS